MAGVGFILLALLAEPSAFGIFPESSFITIFFVGILSAFWGAVLFVFILHTVRQLNLVNQIYRRATRIDLFHLKPVYAFSALTARAGIGLIFFVYFIIAVSDTGPVSTSEIVTLSLFANFSISGDAISLILIGGLLLTGIAAFILPLQGIHQRLGEEKDFKISEVAGRLTMVAGKLHQNLDSDSFDQLGGIHNALAALNLERGKLNEISTWPWERGTLRGFVTAVLIPIMLWQLTRLLENFL